MVESLDQGDGTKSDSVVMDLCNHLIGRAVEVGASDVQVRPTTVMVSKVTTESSASTTDAA